MEREQQLGRTTFDDKSFEMLWGTYDSEMGRFWTRFNLFVVVQAASAFGVLTALKTLVENPALFRALLVFLGLLSLLALAVVVRGIFTQAMFYQLFSEIQNDFPLLQFLLRPAVLSRYTNGLLAVGVSSLMSTAWWFALIWLERTHYNLGIP